MYLLPLQLLLLLLYNIIENSTNIPLAHMSTVYLYTVNFVTKKWDKLPIFIVTIMWVAISFLVVFQFRYNTTVLLERQ